ncbi:MAG: response regulator transcription factor [Bacteroidales bacterium]|nr:response regulator transcription factor [Bacteroidales bacterium]
MLVGVIDSHKVVAQSLALSISTLDSIDAVVVERDPLMLIEAIRTQGINVLLLNIHSADSQDIDLAKAALDRFERLRAVVISNHVSQRAVVRAIKCGVKGFLSADADFQELQRALLTVRGGYEYWSPDVANMLIAGYVSDAMPAPQTPSVDMLSPRQIEILKLWGQNKTNKEIADQLYLSIRTVETHKNHIMQRLNLKTTVDMIKFGIRNNIIEL